MATLTKIACALILTGGLAAPALAAPGDAGSGPTTGATSTSDAGSGATKGASAGSMNTNTSDQNATANGQSSMNGQTAMNAGTGMRITQKLREDMSKAGFTDIKIMPSSFMVRAKDLQGNPVMMVINPDSVTALTEEKGSANSASTANHGATVNSNAAGATPGPSSNGGSQPVTPGGATKP